jgi:hypothetical protein
MSDEIKPENATPIVVRVATDTTLLETVHDFGYARGMRRVGLVFGLGLLLVAAVAHWRLTRRGQDA